VDLLLVDDDGRPVFVDVVLDGHAAVPTRVFEHTRWFEQNRRLFLKAYTADGVVRVEDPLVVFVSSAFPDAVRAAVGALVCPPVRLVRAEYFLIDGAAELLLEDVTPPGGERVSTAVARRTDDMTARDAAGRNAIESDALRALLALFTSGVDGLDGRITTVETGDRISMRLGERRLAEVMLSPASFTVHPGDATANPMVVSDRVSLERALNAVVSLFVREETTGGGGNGRGSSADISDEERRALAEIWGGGVDTGERG
jgi:hypothetical protein